MYVRGADGTTTGNAHPVRIGLNREELNGTGGTVISGSTDCSYPVDSMGHIWAAGTAGDGIIISVRAVGVA